MRDGPLKPIRYREGNSVVIGYDARILRAVCEVWLAARAAGALQAQQRDKAQRAEVLMRALADIGIVSLVDEVTGFQRFRARDELQRILAAYSEEGKDIHDARMILDVTRRVSKAMRLLRERGGVKGTKDRMGRFVWGLAP